MNIKRGSCHVHNVLTEILRPAMWSPIAGLLQGEAE